MFSIILNYFIILKEIDDIACREPQGSFLKTWLKIKFRIREHLKQRSQTHRKSTNRHKKRLTIKRNRALTMKSFLKRNKKLENVDLKLATLTK